MNKYNSIEGESKKIKKALKTVLKKRKNPQQQQKKNEKGEITVFDGISTLTFCFLVAKLSTPNQKKKLLYRISEAELPHRLMFKIIASIIMARKWLKPIRLYCQCSSSSLCCHH